MGACRLASDRDEAESIRSDVEQAEAAYRAAVRRRRRFEKRKKSEGVGTGTLAKWLGISRKTVLKDLLIPDDE